MCTVTIHRASDRLLVTMNRDEARNRAPENPPAAHRGDCTWLAPSDSERGGTWIGVNDSGVVACLMNAYLPGGVGDPSQFRGRSTRGAIIPGLMPQGSAANVRGALERDFDPAAYPPFTLILAHEGGVETFLSCGGDALAHRTHGGDWSHFTSSSWKPEKVAAWRERAFREWRATGCAMDGPLPSLHLMQRADAREWSPLMDREYTTTRSITQVDVPYDGGEAVMRYWPRCVVDASGAPGVSALPLRAARNLAPHG